MDADQGTQLTLRRFEFTATPALFSETPATIHRFWEFFIANIPNDNTRRAYFRSVSHFSAWCERHHLDIHRLEPILIAAYIKDLQSSHSPPSVKQHLSAIRMLFDYLVLGQILRTNPASAVRGPKYVVRKGTTPVLSVDETRTLIDGIELNTLKGLRDRALLATMVYTFARVGAVVGMRVEDYFRQGKRWWFRLHEKGGRLHDVPAHHKAEAYVDSWLEVANIAQDRNSPLFRSFGRDGLITGNPLHENDVLRMIKIRAKAAGLPESICCHTFRATGITAYLDNGGSLEKAQAIAAHSSPRTTKLYDRTSDVLTLEEIERIAI